MKKKIHVNYNFIPLKYKQNIKYFPNSRYKTAKKLKTCTMLCTMQTNEKIRHTSYQ